LFFLLDPTHLVDRAHAPEQADLVFAPHRSLARDGTRAGARDEVALLVRP
jgi:hypothetical protein